jgi:ribonuclease HIII
MQVQGKSGPLKRALETWVEAGAEAAARADADQITVPHIGLDEAGKGDWYGPVVVAAVYVDRPTAAALRAAGVQDSKRLAPTTIERLAGEIERRVPHAWRQVWAPTMPVYNERYHRHQNINRLLAEAYAETARPVYEATHAGTIVCDQFSSQKARLEDAFAAYQLPRPRQQHQAEAISIAVAAASILASDAFSTALALLGMRAAWEGPLPRGASDRARLEAAARHIIRLQGQQALGDYAKLNFKPVKALLEQ